MEPTGLWGNEDGFWLCIEGSASNENPGMGHDGRSWRREVREKWLGFEMLLHGTGTFTRGNEYF